MEVKELIELFKKETGRTETYEQAVKNELVFSGEYVLWLEDFALKQVNGVKTNNDPALNLAVVSNNEVAVCEKPNCNRLKLDNSPLCAYHWDIANS